MPIETVSEQSFEAQVIRSELPVLVEFASPTASKSQTQNLEGVARELEGRVKVARVDLDRSRRLAQLLKISQNPTYLVFVRGRPVNGGYGLLDKRELVVMLEPHLPRPEGALKPQELAQLIQQGQVVAVDTREAAAFGRAHIPGAVNMPLEEIESRLAELHMLPGEPILYCRSGDKSREMSEKLVASGVPVGFLEGGMLAWESSQFPIERPD